MKATKVLLIGYYGVQNIGDEMFLRLLIKQLKRSGVEKDQIILISPEKEFLESKYDINVVHPQKDSNLKLLKILYSLKIYIKTIKSVDIIIYGGGTQIQEFGKNSYKSLIFKVIYLLANKLFYKRPVYHFAVGIDKMKSTIGKKCTKWIYQLSDGFILRDKYSYEYLKEVIKVTKKSKMKVKTDLAFNKDMVNLLQKKSEDVKSNKIKIGISLFPYYEKQLHDKKRQQDFDSQIIKFLKSINTSDYEIHFIPFQGNMGNKDNIYMDELTYDFENAILHNYSDNFEETCRVISEMDICIGMRLHFVIFSLIASKPTIPIDYHVKVEQFTKTLGLQDHMIKIDQLNFEVLLKKLLSIEKNYEKVSSLVKNNVRTEVEKGEDIYKELDNIISVVKK
ncbi:polysaccharide pyruvyl transferase WcaK-like protein [Sinobaca qinghaiensis]|uniref:Polysaccharide pyruvyl transferase WcaK-like protein n=1 Tax=Sinobaca qinghaiensis TaxID=342944 RepID=A0A419V8Q6_9BACL|nr:polysaccharide pyruvyl transferase family protein [Sinobaca qinghaiensis]RKD76309.1 polysaccharide pyruvyl transferase WcaK-like protein [Sinobaca qinghaiensis]